MMTFAYRQAWIGFAMLAAAVLAIMLQPTRKLADERPRIDLEVMIPKQFGDWQVVEDSSLTMVSPEVQAKLSAIYSQTLSRTYVDRNGERVMLAIAYGGDQGDAMKAHRPEVCYPAQGFEVVRRSRGRLETNYGLLPVNRMVAIQGQRIEPVTYWFVTGGQVGVTNLERKLSQLRIGLTGAIPDGLLFRVSSIGKDSDHAFVVQGRFVANLLDSLAADVRRDLIGKCC